ncbi:MAG: glycogen debranching enzyme GlgX, partial [Pseudomonadota bacterium]
HNEANGEGNRDGHDHNCSDNCGVEGPTEDPAIIALRAQRRRNMLATLMLSQGTPMILAGDELGNSQRGNNNAYCQDNEIGWVNWDEADPDFLAFCSQIIAFRKSSPILRQKRFLHAGKRAVDGKPDVFWRKADGTAMSEEDWGRPELKFLGVEMRMARGTPAYEPRLGAIYLVFNAGGKIRATLPEALPGHRWLRVIDTSGQVTEPPRAGAVPISPNSVVALELCPIGGKAAGGEAVKERKVKV